jgi:hypothetical protein
MRMEGHERRRYSDRNAALLGALTFFRPCGFTQTVQLFALSTGRPATAAVVMALFALGTAPGLLGLGSMTSLARGHPARTSFAVAGVAVLAFGFVNARPGLTWASASAEMAEQRLGSHSSRRPTSRSQRAGSSWLSPRAMTATRRHAASCTRVRRSAGSCAAPRRCRVPRPCAPPPSACVPPCRKATTSSTCPPAPRHNRIPLRDGHVLRQHHGDRAPGSSHRPGDAGPGRGTRVGPEPAATRRGGRAG